MDIQVFCLRKICEAIFSPVKPVNEQFTFGIRAEFSFTLLIRCYIKSQFACIH